MLTFWIIAALLMVLAIVFVVPPLLKKSKKTTDVDRNSLNVAIYKERLAELEQEKNLTPEQLAQAKQELEKTLAQDLDDAATPTLQASSRARWVSVIIVAIAIPALAIGMYWQLGSSYWLTPATATNTQSPQAHSQTGKVPSNFDEMVNKLAARLQQQPDDEQGWRMLARSYVYLKQYDKAAQAYNKLLAMVGKKDPQLLTELARVFVLSNDGKFTEQPISLLKTALELDPKSTEALWLSGLAAAQQENYQAAIDYWQRFLKLVPEDDKQARQMLESNIAEARSYLAKNDDSSVSSETPSTVPADKPATQPAQTEAVNKIEVHVSLDPALQDKVKPNDILFVYARAMKGPQMPLAIVRKKANELPISVTLDDSMAMMPTMKLSNFQEIVVLARISSSGSASLKSGDLQGQVSPVILSKQDKVEITINQVAP